MRLPDDTIRGALQEGPDVHQRRRVPNNGHSTDPFDPLQEGVSVGRTGACREDEALIGRRRDFCELVGDEARDEMSILKGPDNDGTVSG